MRRTRAWLYSLPAWGRRRNREILLAIGWIGASAPLALLALVAIIAWQSLRYPARSFIVDARSTGATVHFEGITNAWSLHPVAVCQRLEMIDRNRITSEDERCDRATSVDVLTRLADRNGDVDIEWPEDSWAEVMTTGSGDLEITLHGLPPRPDDAIPYLRDGSRIVISRESWKDSGALAFVGKAQVGRSVGSGERHVLLEGRYEAREPTSFGFLGAPTTQTLLEGTLNRGEEAQIVMYPSYLASEHIPAPVFGHLTPGDDGEMGFHIVLISQPGRTSLSSVSIGQEGTEATDAVLIRPSWVHRTLNGPLLLGLAFIVTLGISAGQLFFEAVSLLQGLYSERPERARPIRRGLRMRQVGRRRT